MPVALVTASAATAGAAVDTAVVAANASALVATEADAGPVPDALASTFAWVSVSVQPAGGVSVTA